MSKWLVTHTTDGFDTHQDVVDAEDYSKAYLAVLYKEPVHYAVGTVRSGVISVIKLPDDYVVPTVQKND